MSCPASRKTLLDYAIPYWRRLLLVLVLSLVSTGLALVIPYLSKDSSIARCWDMIPVPCS